MRPRDAAAGSRAVTSITCHNIHGMVCRIRGPRPPEPRRRDLVRSVSLRFSRLTCVFLSIYRPSRLCVCVCVCVCVFRFSRLLFWSFQLVYVCRLSRLAPTFIAFDAVARLYMYVCMYVCCRQRYLAMHNKVNNEIIIIFTLRLKTVVNNNQASRRFVC